MGEIEGERKDIGTLTTQQSVPNVCAITEPPEVELIDSEREAEITFHLIYRQGSQSYFDTLTFVSFVQDRLQGFDLAVDHLQRWATNRPPLLHARFKVKQTVNVFGGLVVQPLVILQAQFVQLALPRLRKCDRPP